jgi:hypothetical protein
VPTEESPHHDDQEDITEEHSFDELARGMAEGTISRSRALKLVGAALLGFGSLGFLGGGVAEARHRHHRRRKRRLVCGPSNCPGCCDSNGVCQPGGMIAACGTGGLSCDVCTNQEICVGAGCVQL